MEKASFALNGILLILIIWRTHTMQITKDRLVAALTLAKTAKADASAAEAALAVAQTDLAEAVKARDVFKDASDTLNAPEVVALVDELAPAA